MTSGLLKFPGERVASFTTSFGDTYQSIFEVIGTKGVVKMDPAYEIVEDLKCEMIIGGRTIQKTFKKRDQFAPELVYFSKCILAGKEPEPSGREGLADVRIIRALLESAANDRPVSIPEISIGWRPDLDRKISNKAVAAAPNLVKAARLEPNRVHRIAVNIC